MTSILSSSRSLRVETQPCSPRGGVSPYKKSASTPSKSFMKSTASSISKGIITSSVTIPVDAKAEREEMLEKLKNNVVRFTRSSDRRMMLRTLKDCTYLQNIPVDDSNNMMIRPSTNDEWKELELEVAASIPIELNGMVLGATIDEKNKGHEGEKLLQLLQLLCNKLTQGLTKTPNNCYMQINSAELYRALLLRLSPKNSAATEFLQINSLIGSKELVVQVPKKPIKPLRNTSLVVYVSDNAVHAVIEHHHAYGLFRKSDSAGKPWIGLTAVTHERANLSTGISVRRVAVQVHEEKFSIY